MLKPAVFLQALGAGIIVMFTAASANAATITLTGTIRDFNDTHEDFEYKIKTDKGIVQSTLGGDGKPVYAGNPFTPTTTGKDNFDQWYRDVPGVNLSKQYSITLDDTGNPPGIYSYTNNNFFPIDGELLGNQGRKHNYHFTYEIASKFTYQPGQIFKFSGDDDLWVFINKKLAIDLGGVHQTQTGIVNLDDLGLTAGKTYDFNLFFAERHTNKSNFSITTSIALEPPSVPEPLTIGSTVVAAGLGLWMKRKQKTAHLA
ncbi:PEP-CTERM sorting domain-containing protein [Tolypothrix sp. FACHB-123]|uniref:PEP-CTERM sorting domain-containing protein n=1 Tax=Tolypothrix sp. FACHB-123 TaxID=2692868 RepID=UPI00168987D8|nr:PEP-CTERM sorting domain-containing protein [Tolypothrix sp. FACHB-123]MBD2356153.1 PEP-CTERM sorting domain-containing protein [Tolypothrix sp. FACHB-123]